MASFLTGFAAGTQNLPGAIQQGQEQERQKQLFELQKQKAQQEAMIESRKGIAQALEVYDNIINYVPEQQRPTAIKAWVSSVEQQSGQKLSPEIKQALVKGDPDFSAMLAKNFVENPQINGSNLGSVLNNQAMVGMMVSEGKKKAAEEQSNALTTQGQYALTGQAPPQGAGDVSGAAADTGNAAPVVADPVAAGGAQMSAVADPRMQQAPAQAPAQAAAPAPDAAAVTAPAQATIPGQPTGKKGGRSLPNVGTGSTQGAGISPENTGALVAKRDRLELFLANPALPDKLRTSYEKILEDTNKQLQTSVDDKSQILNTARELQLDPSNPVHMGLIRQVIDQRDAQQAGAVAGASETAKTAAQPVDLATARATGVSPFLNRGEVRQLPGAGGVQVLSEAQLEGQKEAAKQNAQPIDLSIARESGINPLLNRGEARQTFGAEGLAIPSQADQAATGEQVKTNAEQWRGYAAAGSTAADRLQTRQELRSLLPYVATGLGAQQRMQLDRLASTFGAKTDGLSAAQAFDMITKHMALANRKDMPGSMSDADREFLVNSEVSLSREKNANYIKMGLDDIIDKRIQERSAAIPKYQRTCGLRGQFCDGKSFDEIWQEYANKNPLAPQFKSVMQQYGAKGSTGKPAGKPAAAAPAPAGNGKHDSHGASADWNAVGAAPLTEEQMNEIEGKQPSMLDRIKNGVRDSLETNFPNP